VWQPAVYNRGFENLVSCMFTSVEKFDSTNREELMNAMKQDDVLLSHRIIKEIIDGFNKNDSSQNLWGYF
jgi:hypothetical protein